MTFCGFFAILFDAMKMAASEHTLNIKSPALGKGCTRCFYKTYFSFAPFMILHNCPTKHVGDALVTKSCIWLFKQQSGGSSVVACCKRTAVEIPPPPYICCQCYPKQWPGPILLIRDKCGDLRPWQKQKNAASADRKSPPKKCEMVKHCKHA